MDARKTVMINGRAYDAQTGLPVETARSVRSHTQSAPKPTPKTVRPASSTSAGNSAAKAVHGTAQRSKTLHRRSTKKPGLPARPQPGRHMDIARSSSVKRFAQHPVAQATQQTQSTPDIAPRVHPTAAKAQSRIQQKAVPAKPATAKEVKDAAIAAELAVNAKPKAVPHKKERKKHSRRFLMAFGILALIAGLSTVAYFQLPTLSVAIAAQQAGVDARYPGYIPDGYSLSQPVTFDDGTVDLTFKANSGTGSYTVSQTKSSWNSAAVLDNVVRPASGDNYIITQERGLTMYAYDGNAAWVNGGVLYTITSDAPLSGDQVRRIATSL